MRTFGSASAFVAVRVRVRVPRTTVVPDCSIDGVSATPAEQVASACTPAGAEAPLVCANFSISMRSSSSTSLPNLARYSAMGIERNCAR